jgi:TonB family protein
MIPRSLVPPDVRMPEQNSDAPAPRRLTTLLDDRTIVAANMPRDGALQTHSNIPASLPLDVLAAREVVPRDMPSTPFDERALHPDYDSVTTMDQRFTVPAAMPVVEFETKGTVAAYDLPDVLEPDVLMTGEANLSVEPIERPSTDWDLISRIGSIAAHILLVIFVIFEPKIFPYKPPTQASVDLGKDLGFIYMPSTRPGAVHAPTPSAPAIRVNPGVLRKMAPMPMPAPAPKQPEQQQETVRQTPAVEPPPELPVAPKPQVDTSQRPDFLTGRPAAAPQAQQPQQSQNSNGLILPRQGSPGRALQDAENQALNSGGGYTGFGSGAPGGGGGYGGSGPGAGLQMLTPTEGVDFSGYLARVLASVRRNWYSVMPESARLGDRGKVILQFRIMKNGMVPDAEPQMMGSSGKEPLDRAAYGAIRASSPFEPLPPAFSGPFIELRFIFLYNLSLDSN